MHEMDDVTREFIIETTENLDLADTDMVELENNPDDHERLSRIFRTVHTVKGACGFLGYSELAALTHNAENLLSALRDGKARLTEDMTSAILATLDNVRRFIIAIEGGETNSGIIDQELVARLAQLLDGDTPDGPQGGPDDATLANTKTEDSADSEAGADTATRRNRTLRVRVGLVDRLMDLVGELVLTRNRLLCHSQGDGNRDLSDSVQCLAHVTDAMQEGIMKMRLQPMSAAWSGVPRLVRDLAVNCGKKVNVELEGHETELDKSLIEAIKDPLVHLVRNVVDHGIEPPADRLKAGKPETGTLRLRAYHEGGQVNIDVEDDGRGFDLDRLRERAIQAGAITTAQADRMTPHEVAKLAFLPGLSTAREVSNVSGRGVGMDVVKANVDSLGGAIELNTIPGQGTRTRVTIPLTLAIVPAIIVRCDGESYAIPQVHVKEFARLDGAPGSGRIEYVHGASVCRLRHDLFPLVRLKQVLGLEPEDGAVFGPFCDDQLVVLSAGGTRFGLVVDEIGSPEEIVVKPLPSMLRSIHALAGTAVIGEGDVALILDVLGLAGTAHVAAAAETDALILGGEEQRRRENEHDEDAYVFVEVSGGLRAAIPIGRADRLETVARTSLERTLQGWVFQHAGETVPVRRLDDLLGLTSPTPAEPSDTVRVVVCRHRERSIALVVEKFLDIVSQVTVTANADSDAISLGTALIQEHATEVIDPVRLLERELHDTPHAVGGRI